MVITEVDMREVLQSFVNDCGNQKTAAALLQISESYLSRCLQGRIDISNQLSQKIGYKRVYHYEKIGDVSVAQD